MMQIKCDPSSMTQAQREAVAGFILAYPNGQQVAQDTIPAFIHEDTADQQLVDIGRELQILNHEHESTLPNTAFGTTGVEPDAAAAFGVTAPPLPMGAIAPASTPFTVAPVAAPPAPTMTTLGLASSAAPAATGAADLDRNGLPWDHRIHAESKAKIADGTWRKKRNLDPTTQATVEAELRAAMGANPAPLPVPIATTPPPAPAAPAIANLPTASVLPAVAPPPPPPAPTTEVDARAQFVALVGRTSAMLQAGKITQDEVAQCCKDATGGAIHALPLLASRLDLVAHVAANIDRLLAVRQ